MTIDLEGAPGTSLDLPVSGLRGADPVGLITRLEHRLGELETRKTRVLADIDHARRQMTHARGSIGQPFPHAAELAVARTRVRDIDEALDRLARDDAKRAETAGQQADDGSGQRGPGAPRTETAVDATRETYLRNDPDVSTRRQQGNQAAVAANEAYRAGDLDRAWQLVDQAAAVDPSRDELWEQHRNQIAARRLILDAQVADTAADHQRAQRLLDDARQLDPRMPAIWDGDLPAVPPTRPAHRDRDVAAPERGSSADTIRAVQSADPQQRTLAVTATGDRESQQPPWPSSPARGEPGHPVPVSSQAHEPKPTAQRFAAAVTREPRAGVDATADPDVDTGVHGTNPSAWPASNPRIMQKDVSPAREGEHTVGTAPEAEASNRSLGAPDTAPSADWRDDIISAAREPWQSGPRWPDNPALHRSPDVRSPELGIEASE